MENMSELGLVVQSGVKRGQRKSRKKDFLKLEYSDPGDLFGLLSSLTSLDSRVLQGLLNRHLQKITSAVIGFLIEECTRIPEAVVRVIGTEVLSTQILLKEDNPFMKRIRNHDEPINVAQCFIDPNLFDYIKDVIKYSYGADFQNCIIIPIYHPYTAKRIFFYGLVNVDIEDKPISHYHGLVGECFRYCFNGILQTLRYSEERHGHEKCKMILRLGMKSMKLVDNLPELIACIKSETIQVLDAERCNLYIVEDEHVVSYISDYGQGFECSEEYMKNVRIPLGVGIIGTVAETGKIINCIDAEEDPLYIAQLAYRPHIYTRNLLAFPVLLYGRVKGVAVALDKDGAIHFTSADEELAARLGPLLGTFLHLCLLKKKLWDGLNRRTMVDCLFLRDSQDTPLHEVFDVMNCQDPHNYPDFFTYNFIPANVHQADVICICLMAFEEYELLKNHFIDKTNFIRFLLKIRSRHKGFPLHNWQHSFSTLHFLRVLAKNEKFIDKEILTVGCRQMELMAMYLAALCHGMESRGSTTPFQPTSGTSMGSLYSTPGSLLQYYAMSQIVRLMTSNENNIIESMDLHMYRDFLYCLDKMLLYMDLAHHVSKREEIQTLAQNFNKDDPQHRILLHSLILTCASLSDYSKPYAYCESFADNALNEYFNNDLSECEGVINLSVFQEEIQVKRIEIIIHFMKTVCEEAFRLLKEVLPLTSECYAQVLENLSKFQAKKERVAQELLEQF